MASKEQEAVSSEDFALSEDAELQGELEELDDEEINEWAMADAPTVISGSSDNDNGDAEDPGEQPPAAAAEQEQEAAETAAAEAAAEAAAASLAALSVQQEVQVQDQQQHLAARQGRRQSGLFQPGGHASAATGAYGPGGEQAEAEAEEGAAEGPMSPDHPNWGWSGGWGLKALGGVGSKLKEVVRDVKELKESFQQAIQEAVIDSGERVGVCVCGRWAG